MRVRLAPGGTLLASVPFTARVEILRQGESAGQTVRSDGGPIARAAGTAIPWHGGCPIGGT